MSGWSYMAPEHTARAEGLEYGINVGQERALEELRAAGYSKTFLEGLRDAVSSKPPRGRRRSNYWTLHTDIATQSRRFAQNFVSAVKKIGRRPQQAS